MKLRRFMLPFSLVFVVGIFIVAGFQNCAKAKFVDPDPRHSALALGSCKICEDETGTGISCKSGGSTTAFAACSFESCRAGFRLEGESCVPVVCSAGELANCAAPNGDGRRTCNANGQGYGACVATTCQTGFALEGGACVRSVPSCVPGAHRACDTESTFGNETCNSEGTGFGACELGSCKPGYYSDGQGVCQLNACIPNAVTPCAEGAGSGLKTCNSTGSAFGACELDSCQQGYALRNGVCVAQVCTPQQVSVCDFDHGSGERICNADGMDYGACTLVSCDSGYSVENGVCVQQACAPGSPIQCQESSGSGVKYCFQNGKGFGSCQLNSCDAGFKLKNSQCVDEDSCESGETVACTGSNGTGIRTCNTQSKKIGPCVLSKCNDGWELVTEGGSPACKKISSGGAPGKK